MPILGPLGVSGGRGRGFALGPVNNLFGTTAGDASASPSTVTPAASKAAAETVRDTYFTANPSNLAEYDADSTLNIRIFYTVSGSNIITHQIRQGSAWVDNGSVTAIQGLPGSAMSFAALDENDIPAVGAAPGKEPVDSGLRAVAEVLYFGDITAENTMRLRRDSTTGYLFFERLESGTWNEKFQIFDSASVDIVNFIESTGPVTVPTGGLAFYNREILDDQGNTILRPFFTDGTNTFPAIASLPNGSVRVIQNLADILANPTTTQASYKTIAFTQDLATVATSGDYNDLTNTPPSTTPRTDEEIRDVIGTALVAGAGITITVDDPNNTITIAATGGPTPPQPGPTDMRFGLSQQSDPAQVTWADLTDVASPTDPQTVTTGTTSAGDYFHIFSASTHDIQTITDTVLQQIVYQDGATSGNIFTKVSAARTESGVTFDAYTVGPLNAGVDESYVVRFS